LDWGKASQTKLLEKKKEGGGKKKGRKSDGKTAEIKEKKGGCDLSIMKGLFSCSGRGKEVAKENGGQRRGRPGG